MVKPTEFTNNRLLLEMVTNICIKRNRTNNLKTISLNSIKKIRLKKNYSKIKSKIYYDWIYKTFKLNSKQNACIDK
jgi:hypothetical protein